MYKKRFGFDFYFSHGIAAAAADVFRRSAKGTSK
jgi:hypothetical protein